MRAISKDDILLMQCVVMQIAHRCNVSDVEEIRFNVKNASTKSQDGFHLHRAKPPQQ
jgi:hypothetical protein